MSDNLRAANTYSLKMQIEERERSVRPTLNFPQISSLIDTLGKFFLLKIKK